MSELTSSFDGAVVLLRACIFQDSCPVLLHPVAELMFFGATCEGQDQVSRLRSLADSSIYLYVLYVSI